MTKELCLFMVKNTSYVFPTFFVEAVDILEATRIAKKIVDDLNNNVVVTEISAIKTPLLKWEE